jgi:hypothetical protein
MKKVLMMTLALTLCAGAAMADHMGAYSDVQGASCALSVLATPPANNTAYVIHKFNTGTTAAQFKVVDTSTLFPTTQTTPYLSIGTWNVDLSLAYGACIIGDHVILTCNFLWFGTPITGCANTLQLVPAPSSPIPGSIAFVDCAQPSGNLETGTGGTLFVGQTSPTCPTGGCDPNATASTTWGGVKALYR